MGLKIIMAVQYLQYNYKTKLCSYFGSFSSLRWWYTHPGIGTAPFSTFTKEPRHSITTYSALTMQNKVGSGKYYLVGYQYSKGPVPITTVTIAMPPVGYLVKYLAPKSTQDVLNVQIPRTGWTTQFPMAWVDHRRRRKIVGKEGII